MTRLKRRPAAESGDMVDKSIADGSGEAGPVIGGAAAEGTGSGPSRGATIAAIRARSAAPAMNQGRLRLRSADMASAGGGSIGADVSGAAGADAATGVPHMLQNRPPSGIRLPHDAQFRSTWRDAPHCEQNLPLASLPHSGQLLDIPTPPHGNSIEDGNVSAGHEPLKRYRRVPNIRAGPAVPLIFLST